MTGAAPSTGFTPVQIATAVLGIALAVTFILPWITFGGESDTALALANDGRDVDAEGRTQIGIYLMQLLFPALVLGPVASILVLIRNSAARGVAIGAGVLGLLVVAGRFLIDFGIGGYGIGTWLGLLVSLALVGLGAAAGSSSGQGASRGW